MLLLNKIVCFGLALDTRLHAPQAPFQGGVQLEASTPVEVSREGINSQRLMLIFIPSRRLRLQPASRRRVVRCQDQKQ
jgi:hypothetical protein